MLPRSISTKDCCSLSRPKGAAPKGWKTSDERRESCAQHALGNINNNNDKAIRRRLLAKKQQLFNIAAPAASTFNGSA